MLKYTKARFVGTRNNLKKEIGTVDGFPLATYLDNGVPVLFANDEENKQLLLQECKELGIEVVL